jgi:hypothetical protein
MRTVIATNATQEQIAAEAADAGANNEIWVQHSEDVLHWQHRAALTPLDAIKHLDPSTFKWLLYCDDDIVFFMNGVHAVVDALDANLPWFISGEFCLAACCCICSTHHSYFPGPDSTAVSSATPRCILLAL